MNCVKTTDSYCTFAHCFNHKALQEHLLSFVEFTFAFHKLCCVNQSFRKNFPLSVYGIVDGKKIASIEQRPDRKYTVSDSGQFHGVFVLVKPNLSLSVKRFYRSGCVHGDERIVDISVPYTDRFYFNDNCIYGWLGYHFIYNKKVPYIHTAASAFLYFFSQPLCDLQRSNGIKLLKTLSN